MMKVWILTLLSKFLFSVANLILNVLSKVYCHSLLTLSKIHFYALYSEYQRQLCDFVFKFTRSKGEDYLGHTSNCIAVGSDCRSGPHKLANVLFSCTHPFQRKVHL